MSLIEPTEKDILEVLRTFSTGTPAELEREYFTEVLRCSINSTNKELSNSDTKHAALLIKLLFGRAKKFVKIHTGSLFNDVYGIPQVIAEARKLIARGGEILIAYSNDEKIETIEKDRLFINQLYDLIDNGAIKIWDASGVNNIAQINHFAVQDESAYRFERDMVTRKAFANFGEVESATKLLTIFDKIREKSRPALGFGS